MSIINKFKDYFAVGDEEYEDGEEFSEDFRYNEPEKGDVLNSREPAKGRHLNIHSAPGGASGLSVVLVKPDSYADAAGIANHLNDRRTVVLNLESTSKDVSRRLVDFLSGAAYAHKGQLKRVANSTYIITPSSVDVMGDELLDEIESGGFYI